MIKSTICIYLLSVFVSVILISGQTTTDPSLPSTCVLSCQTEYTALINTWSTAGAIYAANPTSQQAADTYYNTICTDPSYHNLIQCLINNCAGTTWTADLTDSWTSFESECAANGHTITNGIGSVISAAGSTGGGSVITPPTTTGTTGITSSECVTQCDPIAKQVSTELSGITSGDFAHLCTSSVPSLYKCLTTYCVTDAVTAQTYNTAYNGFANVCRSHGFNVAGSTQGGTSNAYSNISFSSAVLIIIGLLSLLAMKYA